MSQNQVVYKTGIYTEKELVESYGSPAQKNSFESLGWLQTKNKKTLLEKISRYCNITEVSKHIYEITEVYPYIVPANFKKMNTSLYQYICPLILDKIINGHDKTRKIDITIGKWAREINMVNHNYNLCKYNKEDTSRMTDYPINTVNEFYDKSDDMIEYYITNALDYLKSAGLIIWRDVYKVYYEQSNDKITIDSDGIVHANISLESREATQDDMSDEDLRNLADALTGMIEVQVSIDQLAQEIGKIESLELNTAFMRFLSTLYEVDNQDSFKTVKTLVSNIQKLLSGDASVKDTIHLTNTNTELDLDFIIDKIAKNIKLDNLNESTLSTGKFPIFTPEKALKIEGNFLTVTDSNEIIRVKLGFDTENGYICEFRDENGNLFMDGNGIVNKTETTE